MKKIMQIGVYIIYPSLFFAIFLIMQNLPPSSDWIFFVFLVPTYTLPIFGFYYFIKKRPFNQWFLLFGFALVPFWAVIYGFNHAQDFINELILASSIYAVPFFVISLIVAIVLSKKGGWKTFKKQGLIITLVFLLFLYSFSGVFIPFTHENTFRTVVSEIPENMNVGDELTITVRIENRSLRFFTVGYDERPIRILIRRTGEVGFVFPIAHSRLIFPFGSLTDSRTYVFEESGDYVITISSSIRTRWNRYEYFRRIYITVECTGKYANYCFVSSRLARQGIGKR